MNHWCECIIREKKHICHHLYFFAGVERETDQEKEEGNVPLSGLFSPYKVFRLTYGHEDLEKLINLTEYNVLNNVEVILQTLRNLIECKQKRSSSTARL